MDRVRMKDLALVAFAGGLLAFELVSLGEALAGMKQTLGKAGPTASQAAVGAVKGAAHLLAAAANPGPSKSCVVARSSKQLREVERALGLALKQATL